MNQEEQKMILYTAKEVANILKVTPYTIYEYVREGKLQGTRVGNKRTIRFTSKQILDFIGGNGNESDVRSSLDDRTP